MQLEIELIPISEMKTKENTHYIPIARVEYFAYLATTLTPMDAFREIDGYTSALWEYMQDRKYQEQQLFYDYDKLIHAQMGHTLLCTLTELLLMEKDMRNYGISNDILNRYQTLENEYQSLLLELKKK